MKTLTVIRNLLVVGILTLCAEAASATSADAVVASFFPDHLVQLTAEAGMVPYRYQAFEQTNFGEDGQSYVVATYTNGADGAVRVLKSAPGGWLLASEPVFDGFSGKFPDLELVDVTGDGIPEVVASFVDERATEVWIFRWQSHALKLISPGTETDGTRSTDLTNVEFLDIDGDGTPEVIDVKGVLSGDDFQSVDTLYKWSSDHFVKVSPVMYEGVFNRHKGEPGSESQEFRVTGNAAKCQLIVVNGGVRGAAHRTSSAEVKLNGVVVVAPSQFNQQQAVINVPVALQEDNRITVRVAGEPGSQIAVVITPVP